MRTLTGFKISQATFRDAHPSTSAMVLDRAYCHREVFEAIPCKGRPVKLCVREAERVCAGLNELEANRG